MEKKTAYCVLFLVLLVPYTTLGAVLQRAPPKKGNAKVALPAVYIGATVSQPMWAWLVGAYGTQAVADAGVIVSSTNTHHCGGLLRRQGWCRTECQENEYIDDYYSVVCNEAAGYKCCRT